MDFPVKTAAPLQQNTGCAILPIIDAAEQPAITREFDRASNGLIKKLLKSGEISATLGKTFLRSDIPGSGAQRVLFVGCGKAKEYTRKSYVTALLSAFGHLKESVARDAVSYLSLAAPADVDAYYGARLTVEAARGASYRFAELKSTPTPDLKLRKVAVAQPDKGLVAETRRGVRHGIAIANGTALARDLGNRPANICTPRHLAEAAKALAAGKPKLKVRVLAETDMRRLGMGSLLSVTQGAAEPARLIVMEYRGAAKDSAPIAICGKGVTFDTGGISLKPPAKMDEMKFDMCGAAGVIGAMACVAEMELEINVIAVVPACENMPGSNATRPGDIVTSLSGKTIEILNTDAEGRLILCDAMTYAQSFKPRCLVDVATLTGACVVALGGIYTGVFSNDAELADEIVAAGGRSCDVAWRMPADREYGDSLRSNFADFANVGAREGGASVAAAFLGKFVNEGLPWAHLDIAGVAWQADRNKGATGRPVPLLVDFLLNY